MTGCLVSRLNQVPEKRTLSRWSGVLRFRRGTRRWLLTASAVAGAATGALLTWAFTNRTFILLGGALPGCIPALLKASAFYTNAY